MFCRTVFIALFIILCPMFEWSTQMENASVGYSRMGVSRTTSICKDGDAVQKMEGS